MSDSLVVSNSMLLGLRIRAFELKLLSLFGEGQIRGTVHTCWGQELPASVLSQLVDPNDVVFGTHRGHGYFLGLTQDYQGLAREILGREGGVSRGIGGSQHLHSNSVLTNGVQGGLVPVAAGAASAMTSGIAIAVIGDGTLGQGVLYETLNIAALQSTAMLIILEDNGIAQTTPQIQTIAGSISDRFRAFDLDFYQVSDAEPLELVAVMTHAIRCVREKRKPAVLQVNTRRLGPHSKGDDNRPTVLINALNAEDPLNRFIELSESNQQLWSQATQEIDDLFNKILSEPSSTDIPDNAVSERLLDSSDSLHQPFEDTAKSIRKQVTASIRWALETNSRAAMFGEDIVHLPPDMQRPYNGAFGVSDDLSESFPERVIGFPISEQAMVGYAIGRSLMGDPTIVEIMFGDFTTLVVDQIRQQASKIAGIYDQRIKLPFLLRTPMGGRRGYGPTHSQSLEGMFFGIPHTIAFAVSPFGVGIHLFYNLLRIEIPVIFFENKDLYVLEPRTQVSAPYSIERSKNVRDPFLVSPKGRTPHVTIVTYGFAAELTLRAIRELATKHETFVEILIYEILSPLRVTLLLQSLHKTGKLVIVEEGISATGLSGTVVTELTKANFREPFSLSVVGALGDIGASAIAESTALINEQQIIKEVVEIRKGGKPWR